MSMNPRSVLVAAALTFAPAAALGDAAAVATPAGGIRLREEHKVSMTRERLTISKVKPAETASPDASDRYHVRAEYEFIADRGADVYSEVGFPVPEYSYGLDLAGTRRVDAFTVEVDGRRIEPTKQVRAYVQQRDVTTSLTEAGIDIESFGGFHDDSASPGYTVARLSPQQREKLVAQGLIRPPKPGDLFELAPAWSVVVTYSWRQAFPAGRTVRIRQDYDAVSGLAYSGMYGLQQDTVKRGFPNGCFDEALLKALGPTWGPEMQPRQAGFHWVTYLLTTANTWKTPIKDFELLIDFPDGDLVSLCWDGPVERIGKTRFRAVRHEFIPTKELTVYFLMGEKPLVGAKSDAAVGTGDWWLRADPERQRGYVDGAVDCLVSDAGHGSQFSASFETLWWLVTEHYRSRPGGRAEPAYKVLLDVSRRTREPPRTGGEEYPEKHGFFDGEFWRTIPLEHQQGFIEGYLGCWKGEALHGATFSKPAAWYRDRINEWYGTTDDPAAYRAERRDSKIADALRQFRD